MCGEGEVMKKKNYDIDPEFGAPKKVETPEEIALREEEEKKEKKQSRLAKASFVWTVISMLYALISGAVLISNNWILAPYSYIMAGLLGVYVVMFAALLVCYAEDAKKGKKRIKTFKKLFGMFRIFTTLVFLVATAISMAGVVEARGTGLVEWLVLGGNMLVAAIQLSLKIAMFIVGIVARKVGKKYTVKVQTYVNGIVRENKAKSTVMSKLYGTEVTKPAASAKEEGEASRTPAPSEQKPAEQKNVKYKVAKEAVREFAASAAARLAEKAGGRASAKKGTPESSAQEGSRDEEGK